MLHSLIANGSSEQTVCRISHTHWYGCPFLLFCLIANSSNGLTVWPESHTQLKSEPCLMHPTSQMFCTFFDGFYTPPFLITDMFATYHTHLLILNHFCSLVSTQTVYLSEPRVVYRTHLHLAAHFFCYSSSQTVNWTELYALHCTHN